MDRSRLRRLQRLSRIERTLSPRCKKPRVEPSYEGCHDGTHQNYLRRAHLNPPRRPVAFGAAKSQVAGGVGSRSQKGRPLEPATIRTYRRLFRTRCSGALSAKSLISKPRDPQTWTTFGGILTNLGEISEKKLSPLLGTIAANAAAGDSSHGDREGSERRTCLNGPLYRLPEAMKRQFNAHAIVDQLAAIYDELVANLRQALARYVEDRTAPDGRRARRALSPTPNFASIMPASSRSPSLARLRQAEPARHLRDQHRAARAVPRLSRRPARAFDRDYDVNISVGRSASEIPYAYVIENSGIQVGDISTAELSRFFPSNELVHLGDEIADGVWVQRADEPRPLALFDGPRTDFSLARLRHYTGTPPEHFQHFVLFTNYVRYVDEFVAVAIDTLRRKDSRFTSLSVPGALYEPGELRCRSPDRRGPMAAAPDAGLSFDGRRPDGDYAGQYRRRPVQREDGVRPCRSATPRGVADDRPLRRPEAEPDHRRLCPRPRLPARRPCARRRASAEIPLPAIAEVQNALFDATTTITGEDEDSVKRRLRTGTVVTTDDRNWELRYAASALRFNQSRAVGDRHGIGDRRRAGLPLPSALRHLAVRLRQAAPRRAQAAGSGERLLRAGDQPAPSHRHRGAEAAAARRRKSAQPQAPELRRAAAALAH